MSSEKYRADHRVALCEAQKEYYQTHRDSTLAYQREYVKNNRDKVAAWNRAGHLRRAFGISPTDYQNILEEQGSVCAICGTDKPGGRFNRFCVDHSHKTGMVRGILCNDCNAAIGFLGDNPKRAYAAFKYLDSFL